LAQANSKRSPSSGSLPPPIAGGQRAARSFSALAEMQRQVSDYTHGVRTQHDGSTPPDRALAKLKEGNERFTSGTAEKTKNFKAEHREALATHGQLPMAAILGCADSRAPIEIVFDVKPGDLFVLRNAGNTLSHAEGSVVGSLEYCVGPLKAKLIVVLGHTKCGAMMGATTTMLKAQEAGQGGAPAKSALEKLLGGLGPVAQQAQLELGPNASAEEIAAHVVKVNVFAGMERLLIYSEPIREKVRSGEVQLHGAVYDISTGKVEFLGQHPRLPLIMGMQAGLINTDKSLEAIAESAAQGA